MKKKHYYVVPEVTMLHVYAEQNMLTLSAQGSGNVQDEIEDEDIDDDAPFGF